MRAWSWALAGVLATGACGSDEDSSQGSPPGGDGTVPGCAGSYEGTFEGDLAGATSGSLSATGSLNVSLLEGAASSPATGTISITPNSEMVIIVGAYQVRGTFDPESCTIAGTWAQGRSRGTWSLRRVSA